LLAQKKIKILSLIVEVAKIGVKRNHTFSYYKQEEKILMDIEGLEKQFIL
jgi:hypothetical protein